MRSIGECHWAPIEPPERNKGPESPYNEHLTMGGVIEPKTGDSLTLPNVSLRGEISLSDTSHEKCNRASGATPLRIERKLCENKLDRSLFE